MDATEQTRSHVGRIDLRDESHGVEDLLGFEGVVTDRVTLDDGRNDLVDSNRPRPHERLPSEALRLGTVRPRREREDLRLARVGVGLEHLQLTKSELGSASGTT